MFDYLRGIANRLQNLGQGIVTGITSFFDSFDDNIINGIKDLIVPSEDYITTRWLAIRSRFSFVDTISETAQIIFRFFAETSFDIPPTIKIDFGYAESEYNWGGETFCLDMTWYARYKPIVDTFLSAWIWIVFLMRLYTHLPNIISGAAGDFEVVNKTHESKDYIKWSLRGGKK